MRMRHAGLLFAVALASCQAGDGNGVESGVSGQSSANLPAASAGKLAAPISIEYAVTGSPVVGVPVSVTITVSTPLQESPITLHTRMSEPGSMTFPAAQPESTLMPPIAGRDARLQQLTLIPQREGRLFLVVSAEIESSNGTMMKSLSVPIEVGRSSSASGSSDAIVEGSDGEAGISLPAQDRR